MDLGSGALNKKTWPTTTPVTKNLRLPEDRKSPKDREAYLG